MQHKGDVIKMVIAIVCVGLFFLNAINRKNKPLFLVSLLAIWSMITFVTNNADEALYINRYYSASEWSFNTEFLFQLLNTICYKSGLSFVQYKGVLSSIYILLIGTSIWKLSRYPNLVLILFFLCPFPLNASQLRFALASAFLIYGYRFLVLDYGGGRKENSIDDIKFVIVIMIAACIHSAALCWLFLPIIKRFTVRQTIVITFIFFVFIYFILNPQSIAWLLYKIGAGDRMMAYFSIAYQQSEFRHFGAMAVTFVFISIMTISCCLICKRKSREANIDQLLKFNIFIIVALAFILRYTAEMYRIQEGLMLLNYIMLLNEVDSKCLLRVKAKKRDMLIQFNIIILVMGSFILKVLLYTNYDYIWLPIFYI